MSFEYVSELYLYKTHYNWGTKHGAGMKLGPETKHNKTNKAKSKKYNSVVMMSVYAVDFNFPVSTGFAALNLLHPGKITNKSISIKFRNLLFY